jgi:hypothetical protein
MKKIAFSLATLFLSSSALAALPNGVEDFQVNMPLFKGGFVFGAGGIYIRANTPDLQYAVEFDSPARNSGRFFDVVPGYKFGYELSLGYQIPCSGNDFKLHYLQFDEKSTEHIGSNENFIASMIAPTTLSFPDEFGTFSSGGVSVDLLLIPATTLPVNFTVSQASAGDAFRQDVLDLEFGQSINVDNFIRIRLHAGLRDARIRHRQSATYIYNTTLTVENSIDGGGIGDPLTTTVTLTGDQLAQTVKDSSHFVGLGPRVGIDGSFHLGAGFGLVGKLSTALLVGNLSTATSEEFSGNSNFTVTDVTITGLNPGVTLTSLTVPVGTVLPINETLENLSVNDPSSTRIIPNIEAKMALDYSFSIRGCSTGELELGYYVTHYFNAVDRIPILDVTQTNTLDADFRGPYLSLTITL